MFGRFCQDTIITSMNYLKTAVFSLLLAGVILVPTARANAATSSTHESLLAQIQALQALLDSLERQIRDQGGLGYDHNNCYRDTYGGRYCIDNPNHGDRADNIDRIEVDFNGDYAQVRVVYDDGDVKRYAIKADTEDEVAAQLSSELNLSKATILNLIEEDDGDDEVRSIDVTWRSNHAEIVVRLRNGDVDRFTIANMNRNEGRVIDELANRYDMDEDDVRDVIDFDGNDTSDDIESIDVTFDGDDADVVVRFEDDDTERFTLRNVDEDEDEVISLLADRYDMDEEDIEDLIDFD